MRRLTCPGWLAVCLAIVVALWAAPAAAHDLNPPEWRGDPLSAFFHWEWTGGLFVDFEYDWVGPDDPTSWYEWHGGDPMLESWLIPDEGEMIFIWLPNFIDDLPLKLARVQINWEGPSTSPPQIDEFETYGWDGWTNADAPGVIAYSSPIQPWTQPDGGYQYHDLEFRPNPDHEHIRIWAPEGVRVNQIVIDTISTVPEPSALVLLAVGGMVGLAVPPRRRAARGRQNA
jgi:hypothetical protein